MIKSLAEIKKEAYINREIKKLKRKNEIIAFLLEHEELFRDLTALDLDTLEALEDYVKGML